MPENTPPPEAEHPPQHIGPFQTNGDQLYNVVLPVCEPCILGMGDVCHTPGCLFIRRSVHGPVCEAIGATGAETIQERLIAVVEQRYGVGELEEKPSR